MTSLLQWGLLLGGLLSFSYLAAQDQLDEELLIIEEEEDALIIEEGVESSGPGYWSEHFSGSLAGSYSGIGDEDTTRWNSQLRLRYNEERGATKLALEGRVYRSYVKFNLVDEGEEDGEKFSRDFQVDGSELLESYVDIDINRLLISAGRKRIVWGQFDFFSPVDVLLPLDFAGTTLTFSKLDNRLPQNVVSAELFLPNGFEIQYYYFPNVILDALTEDFFEGASYTDEENENVDVPYMDPADDSQQAVRLLYTGSRMTVGFTFFDGYNYFPQDFFQLVRGSGNTYLCRQIDPDLAPRYAEDCLAGIAPTDIHGHDYISRPQPSLPPNRSFGFELAIPVGRMAYKLELSRNEIPADLQVNRFGPSYLDYIEWVKNENDGKEYVDTMQNFYAIGLDYYGERWIVNLNLISFAYEFDAHAQRGIDLAVAAGEDNAQFDSQTFPAFHAARTYGANFAHRVGWALGTVGFAQGTTLYYQNTAVEPMFFLVSVDILEYLNDGNLVEQVEDEEEGEDLEREGETSVGIRLGFSYSF